MKEFKFEKIAIIGGPGTGKTTLADNLGHELDLPIIHIDGIHHLENWEIRDKDERDRIILSKIDEPKWVIDGTYRSTLDARISKADAVIYLNYSSMAKVKGILSRYFKNKNQEKPEIPGCKEKMDFTFLKWTWNWEKDKGQLIRNTIAKYENSGKNILIFKNRKSLNKWYKETFNKSIIC